MHLLVLYFSNINNLISSIFRLHISEQKQVNERSHRTRRRNYIKLRGRSLEFEEDNEDNPGGTLGGANDFGEEISSLKFQTPRILTQGTHRRGHTITKTNSARSSCYANIPSMGGGVPHSRSDSRLNREIDEDDDDDEEEDEEDENESVDSSEPSSSSVGIESKSSKMPTISHVSGRGAQESHEIAK